jgi:hypothetical protein
VTGIAATNVLALGGARESLAPWLARSPAAGGAADADEARWARHLALGRTFDRVHARFLVDRWSPEIRGALAALRERDPGYAPLRFLLGELEFWDRMEPALVAEETFGAADRAAGPLRIAAVRQFVGRDRVLVSFVDPARREIYGQRYLDGAYERLEDDVKAYVAETLAGLRSAAGAEGAGDAADVAAALRREASRRVGPPLSSPR